MKFFDFFQSDSNYYSVWQRLIALFVIIAFGVFFAKTLTSLYQKSQRLRAERERKEKDLAALVTERKRLEKEIAILRQESSVEREAKARLNYKKEGERVAVIIPEEKNTASVVAAFPREYSWRERFRRYIARFLGFTH